ncbi:hypothetical protein CISG_01292 [Coccidioides immitis RMSCC 3703]|uniref:Uncharacterized protein n=1 Tax=Coccidioides immitis RMSCC 3703 TaxID=454286 RepID=A0A0J8QXA4_COCIT|nr:hypothetical protein CISG_01292 [Coccidioides immitis RMSCC 3703]
MRAAKVTLLAALAQLAAASYELMDDYNPSNFFDKFEFFSASDLASPDAYGGGAEGRDPSNGYVAYQGKEAALSSNLAPETREFYPYWIRFHRYCYRSRAEECSSGDESEI